MRWAFALCVALSVASCATPRGGSSGAGNMSNMESPAYGIDQAGPMGAPIDALGNSSVIFFPFDVPKPGSNDYTLNSSDQKRVEDVAQYLKDNTQVTVLIEGHCDPRGTKDYNLALGSRRATFFKDQIVAQGIDPSRINVISYGKEHPACTESDESCYAQDRRAIVVSSKQ